MSVTPVLGIIPARGGSKGLPGKNIKPLAGLPLIVHTLRCAAMTRRIDRVVCSTDSEEIATVVRHHGGDVPFMRPAGLAGDASAVWPVLRHALLQVEELERRSYGSIVLLDPTSPGRLPSDIDAAVELLASDHHCDGVVGVSIPDFNPLWHCVVEKDGYMHDLMPSATTFDRRQDVPTVYRINATVYCWRRDAVMRLDNWRAGTHRILEVPESRAVHIDDREQFELTELRLQHGLLNFPWLDRQ